MKFRSLIIKTKLVLDDVKRFGLKVYTSLVSSITGNKNDSFAVGQQQTFPSSFFLHSFFLPVSGQLDSSTEFTPNPFDDRSNLNSNDEISSITAKFRGNFSPRTCQLTCKCFNRVSTRYEFLFPVSPLSFHIPFIFSFFFFTSCEYIRQWIKTQLPWLETLTRRLSVHGKYKISRGIRRS